MTVNNCLRLFIVSKPLKTFITVSAAVAFKKVTRSESDTNRAYKQTQASLQDLIEQSQTAIRLLDESNSGVADSPKPDNN